MFEINTLKDMLGQKAHGLYLIKGSKKDVTKNGSPFMDISLMDATGEILGKLWDAHGVTEEDYPAGAFVEVSGSIKDWNGKLQLVIDEIYVKDDVPQEEKDKFVKSAPFSGEEMFEEVYNTANNFKNKDLKSVVTTVLNEQKDILLTFPGAKSNHHDYIGGLLHHTSTMLKVAKNLIPIYPFLNAELLYAGVILHDIGKIKEYELSPVGLVTQYSPMGNMLGHVQMGYEYVGKVCDNLNVSPNVKLALQHMILSHHGRPEWGSSVQPMFTEAYMLHMIDMIDSHIVQFNDALKGLEDGEMKAYPFMEQKFVYKLDVDVPEDKKTITKKTENVAVKQEEFFLEAGPWDDINENEELTF